MRKALFLLALLASAFTLPLAARADTIDDFVITGGGNLITFSLPASPPGNLRTCPIGIITSCLPGSETDFSVSTLVTFDGVTTLESIDFPTGRFGGGLSLTQIRLFSNIGDLFTPDAANPTFLIGSFNLNAINPSGNPPIIAYDLTITPETSAATPEPSSLALLATGALGLIAFTARRKRAHHLFD
jgi:hypothetical protein